MAFMTVSPVELSVAIQGAIFICLDYREGGSKANQAVSLEDEVALIHQAPWTKMTVAYMVCRYYPLVIFPFNLWGFMGDHDIPTCLRVVHLLYLALIPLQSSAQEIWIIGGEFTLIKVQEVLGNTACLANDVDIQDGRAIRPGDRPHATSKDSLREQTSRYHRLSNGVQTFITAVCLLCRRARDGNNTLTCSETADGWSTRQKLPLSRYGFVLALLQTSSKPFSGLITFLVISGVTLIIAALYLQNHNVALDGHSVPFALVMSDVLLDFTTIKINASNRVLSLRRKMSPTETMVSDETSRIVREGLRELDQLEKAALAIKRTSQEWLAGLDSVPIHLTCPMDLNTRKLSNPWNSHWVESVARDCEKLGTAQSPSDTSIAEANADVHEHAPNLKASNSSNTDVDWHFYSLRPPLFHCCYLTVSSRDSSHSYSRVRTFVMCLKTRRVTDYQLLAEGGFFLSIHQEAWTKMKVAYIICRYYPLVVFPFNLWGFVGDHDLSTCYQVVHLLYLALIPLQVSPQQNAHTEGPRVAVIMLLRAYAFTGRRKSLLVIFSATFLVLFAAEIRIIGVDFTRES
ncbi:hypothetical protein HYDPIDRAFT_167906 [Hydnomerulius pinastri MD-312]|uniref:Uncharacterized protein n=1 Tax=Hydnomerulius pinastri MD-312 TaxID=994086 RepID=A0A0C9WFA9_9AGAM|nr:hypothetical protein HYDPIDRAFT_167906 [Hydnomerulius pinastri MD-312]